MRTPLEEARFVDSIEAAAFEDFYAVAPGDLARALGLKVSEIAGATLLHAPRVPQSMFNRAIGFGVDRQVTESDLDAVVGAFSAIGYPGYWIHYNPIAAPAELPRWLEARGFSIPHRRSWAKMLRGNDAPPEVDVPFEVREGRPGEEGALAQVVCSAFGMPPSFAPWVAALSRRPRWRAFAALNDKQVIGAGYLYIDGPAAWLGIAGVLSEARGHNAHRALMSIRIREAIAAGCTRIATETGEPVGDEPNPSLANMRYCGFRQVCSRINYAAKT